MSFQKVPAPRPEPITDPFGILPAPVALTPGAGTTAILDGTRVVADPALRAAARWWRRTTEDAFGLDLVPAGPSTPLPVGPPTPLPVDRTAPASSDAPPVVRFGLDGDLPPSGYRLTVDAAGVRVDAGDLDGAHAAAQTLRQLAGPGAFRRAPADAAATPTLALPHVTIADHPRFPWRGVLLDVARHFLPTADVLRFVDLAAAHRLNVLQLHLTDDQGWRMEIARYPRLTEVGAWRSESGVGTWRAGVFDGRPHGGFYTQDDLREIVAYARERGVTVVPEIDAPGHVEAAVAAYPELGTRKQPHEVRTTWGVSTEVLDPSEESLTFFRHVLDEVLEVFDAPFVAIGGDEVPTTLWRENPTIVARAEALGLDDVGGLHGWFLARLAEHVASRGRRAVVWDEAFGPALPRDVVVTSWRGWAVGADALAAGHDVVMAPEQVVYLDHRGGDTPDEPVPVGFLTTLDDVYAFEPLPSELAGSRADSEPHGSGDRPGALLGGQAELWSEHLDSARRVDYAAFPRLAAFAEVMWSPEADRSPGSPASRAFRERLVTHHLPRLDAAGVEYRPLDGPHPWQTRPGVAGWPRDRAAELAAGGLRGVGGWVEGRDEDEGGPA
ncbi:beta-N-acetylhexosaminidase [Cellulosimicrobium cellulans]|uniref:beta-N-acetylhexosaminidase n=1 Tax=Cellulosimicrobium cellulans TaxID=1710 RepID=UPI002097ACBB|nr:beta-N-acetylhexosaminidase [Cellulosimicrobium cellulans]MCO7274232.1 beta-N-acetylhexosaminidase [Cellulosimicrobium cellulans]